MAANGIPPSDRVRASLFVLVACLFLLVGAVYLASQVQRDFGRVDVTNVRYWNEGGILVRAKLFRPAEASTDRRMPGVVYIHGYQNNRETSDPYCIELARRGFVVLNIDAIGRGNSGEPDDPKSPHFDKTFGGRSSLLYLRSLPYVRVDAVGMMGHSLGAEMAYTVALEDPSVRALVISGYAYTEAASRTAPKNMLMIIGKWDEYRGRMTGVRDIEKEWMSTPRALGAFPVSSPGIGVTYGDFREGTARRVTVPRAIHIQVSHSKGPVTEALDWMRQSLLPPPHLWLDPEWQIWPLKEWATLVALIAGFACLLSLGRILLATAFFTPLRGCVSRVYSCSWKAWVRHAGVNGVLMLLYLPLIFLLFGLHVYVVRIDQAFPMMMVNALVWWFLCINILGFLVFRRWFRKEAQTTGLTLENLGVSDAEGHFHLDGGNLLRTVLLALVLFASVYLLEHVLEVLFIVDWRFIFPFANDLTSYRFRMFLLYLPFLLLGFLQTGVFLHGQLRRPESKTRLGTFLSWSSVNSLALVTPLLLILTAQYVPLFTTGAIPFVGPGGMLANFVMTLFHVIGILLLTTPISTWFFMLTGRIYVGALLNAMLVTWMLVSSQVIAPVPV
jgi:uncharacterized protein